MNWPTSQDYNEAIQTPASCFADPALKKGEPVLNAIGLPVPRSGNFADVYEYKTPDGKKWALKLFTRKVSGLQQRYQKIDEHLRKAKFKFTVGFQYLPEGIRVQGQWFPLLKMEWVEGYTLNEFVRDNANKPKYLHALMQMWTKLTAKLRDANFAHADLQHGNVLLVPASSQAKLQLRLIDYDGMWVPALAETHSGEVGHPNFQHPLRLKDRLYNADVDRFPHLVIAAALRGTLIGGKALWDKFDNGDNLLFKETDLRDPGQSPVFKALWALNDDVLCTLIGKITLATREPLRKTPWLDDVLLEAGGPKLNVDDERRTIQILGVKPHFTATKVEAAEAAAIAPPKPIEQEFNVFASLDDDTEEAGGFRGFGDTTPTTRASTYRRPQKKGSPLPYVVGGAVVAALVTVGIILATRGKPTPTEVAKNDKDIEQPKIIAPKKDDLIKHKVDPKEDLSKKEKVDPIIETKIDDPKKQDPKVEKKDPIVEKKEEKKDPVVEKKESKVDPAGAMIAQVWANQDTVLPITLAINKDGSRMYASPGTPADMRILDGKDGKVVGTIPIAGIAAITIAPDDSLIISDAKPQAYIWDPKTKKERGRFTIASSPMPLAVSQEDGKVYVPDKLTGGMIFSVKDAKPITRFDLKTKDALYSITCTPDGQCHAGVTAAGEINVHPLKAQRYAFNHPSVRTVRFTPDGKHLLGWGIKSDIVIFDSETGKDVKTLHGHSLSVADVAITPDGSKALSVSNDRTLRLWDVQSGKQLQEVELPGGGKCVRVSGDGRYAVTCTANDNGIQLWRLAP